MPRCHPKLIWVAALLLLLGVPLGAHVWALVHYRAAQLANGVGARSSIGYVASVASRRVRSGDASIGSPYALVTVTGRRPSALPPAIPLALLRPTPADGRGVHR